MNTMNMKNKEYLWFTDFKKKVPAPQQTTAMAEINISDKRDIQQRGSLHHSPLFSKISLASHHSPHASRRRCRQKKKKKKNSDKALCAFLSFQPCEHSCAKAK